MKKQIIDRKGYKDLLKDIKSILKKGLSRAYKAVDNLKVQTYWQVGERIVREELGYKNRADYGRYIIEKLAKDIGFSRSDMFTIVQFYKTYPIVHALSGQLSWTHYRILIRIDNKEKREFYEIETVRNRWNTRELDKRIKNKEYERAEKKGKVIIKLPLQLPSPEEVFKESYDWNFLELEKSHSEKQLEKAILENVERILLEFGSGFAFMSSQRKILIAGQYHKIDLVFYHRFLRCFVIIDLKTEKFKAGFVGQMNKYLTYFRENKLEFERDPIGLIICKEKDEEEVHYALGKLKKDIFVAEYKAYLPSEEEIKQKLKKHF